MRGNPKKTKRRILKETLGFLKSPKAKKNFRGRTTKKKPPFSERFGLESLDCFVSKRHTSDVTVSSPYDHVEVVFQLHIHDEIIDRCG